MVVIDWSGRQVTSALKDVPAKWTVVNVRDAGFSHYEAGVDLIRARVEYDHKRGYWVWELYSGCRYVPVADNEYRGKPCATALQAVRAVQRAAKKHHVSAWF